MTNTQTPETGPGRVYLYPGDEGHECGRKCPSNGGCPYYIDWYYEGGAQELEEAERQAEVDWDGYPEDEHGGYVLEIAAHDAASLFEEDVSDAPHPQVHLFDPADFADQDPLMGTIHEQLTLELGPLVHAPLPTLAAPMTNTDHRSK